MVASATQNRRVTLHAGELLFGKGRRTIFTLLGSCVSVTLYHPQKKLAGICHFALPGTTAKPKKKPDPRYAVDCFMLFQKHAQAHNCKLSEFKANIIGGGNMLNDPTLKKQLAKRLSEEGKVGERNALTALKLAHQYGLDIQTVDVGEFGYRKVQFSTDTGKISVSLTEKSS